MGKSVLADKRDIEREDVNFSVRAFGPDARQLTLLIVNISPHGLMARCPAQFAVRERIHLQLPVVGVAIAEVRWCMSGRFGGQFDSVIDRASFYELLATMMRRP